MEQQMDGVIYSSGLNKRVELRVEGDIITYTQQHQDGFILRLRCDKRNKRMVLEKRRRNEIKFEKVDESKIIRGAVMDLGDNGERWEGDLLNKYPFGYGCVYNNENELVYSGFVYKGEKMCFGKEFEQSVLQYCGTFYKNQRHGIGKLYDRMGKLMYKGNWYYGRTDLCKSLPFRGVDDDSIHYLNRELIIGARYRYRLKELKIADFPVLKLVVIGKGCFRDVDYFEVSNCAELKRLTIGRFCFQLGHRMVTELVGGQDNIPFHKVYFDKTKGRCLIHDCARLNEISIGGYSFGEYHQKFELRSIERYD